MVEAEVRTVLWALGVQLGVAFLIAVFFLILARGRRRLEVRWWTQAWFAELAAVAASLIMISSVDGSMRPSAAGRALLVVYAGAKTIYALQLSRGARAYVRHGLRDRLRERWAVPVGAAWALAIGLLSPDVRVALALQWALVATILLYGAWICRRLADPERAPWLGWVLLAVGLLYLIYLPPLVPVLWGGSPLYSLTTVSSLLDAGADLVLALAFLVAIEQADSARLRSINRALRASQAHLRQMVDLDPLTGLRNRRGLRRVLDHLAAVGGSLIFLDIDGFKSINDRWGHAVGDACLLAVADRLGRCFRPEDALFRWGGDEFLVVAAGLGSDAARRRVEEVRQRLATRGQGPPCRLSVGLAQLEPGADPAPALRLADARMYRDKRASGLEPEAPAEDHAERTIVE